jgi:sugar lactone lactonase YvrE
MRRNRQLVLSLVVVAAGCGVGTTDQSAPATSTTPYTPPGSTHRIADIGFSTPESVLHDPVADVYLVSNINGSPLARDDNGFISRVTPEGEVESLKWIDGAADAVTLNAPKGMALIGDELWIADIDAVRRFDRTTGEPRGEVAIPGGTFVNDVAPAADGGVLVTDSGMEFGPDGPVDTGSASVWKISADGVATRLAEGADLARPNGVIDDPDRGIVVVTYASNRVYTVAADGSHTDIATLPAGGLDGIVRTRDERLLVSSWELSGIISIAVEGTVAVEEQGLPAPADIGYDAGRDRLLAPLFNDDAVVILDAGSKP